jgi:hypothetical protein
MSCESYERVLFCLQMWCGNSTQGALKLRVVDGVHSPNRFRVIGTLSNSKEFSKAWGCPAGSPMNPEKKCILWWQFIWTSCQTESHNCRINHTSKPCNIWPWTLKYNAPTGLEQPQSSWSDLCSRYLNTSKYLFNSFWYHSNWSKCW